MKKFSNLSNVVYKRTYARQDDGVLEDFDKTCDRVIRGNTKNHNVSAKELERLEFFLKSRKAGPAGRGWWFSGSPGHDRLGGVALCNCWALTAERWQNFVTAQDLLMLGGGVGMSVEKIFVSKLSKVKQGVTVKHQNTKDADFIVPDSREGWNTLLEKTLEAFFETGKSFTYSTIIVRGKDEPIKGFGGKSSGPLPLINCIEKISEILNARAGKYVRSIDAMDVLCCIGEQVVAGNVRRSAIIILGDANDKDYLVSKRWDLGPVPNQRAMANLSVVCDDIDDLHPLFWATYQNGEPFGIVNRKNIRTYGRMGEKKKDTAFLVNPCVVGQTLVAVADGRVAVSIKQLAEEGKDVPVLTFNAEGKLDVRTMRSVRVTGYNQPIVKVTLDNGESLRLTKNHKMLTNDRGYVEASDLKTGDSLRVVMKRQATLGLSPNLYWTMHDRAVDKDVFEHRLIAQFSSVEPLAEGNVVHHKDRNSLNNTPSNLEVTTIGDHNVEHNEQMGSSNMKYSGFTHEEVREAARVLTKTVGRRVSVNEWVAFAKEKGFPTKFSGWRENHLGGLVGLLTSVAIELGFENTDLDPRTTRFAQELSKEGYLTQIVDGQVKIVKNCEQCGKPILASKKGVKYCGSACTNHARSTESRLAAAQSLSYTNKTRQAKVKIDQIEAYLTTKKKLGRPPTKKEWIEQCKIGNVSVEISRKSSPFLDFKKLQEAAENHNHKVVGVEDDGVDTVYNGTVDDFSNYFIGCFDETPTKGNKKLSLFNGLNCAEATLENAEPCNLSEIALHNIKDQQEFNEAARLMHRWGKRVTMERYHIPEAQEVVSRNRRIGTGITGCLSSPLFNPHSLDEAYAAIQDENVKHSKVLGIPESIRTTVVKPSGTISKVLDSKGYEGIHPAYSRYFIQRVRFSSTDPLVKLLSAAGHHVEPVIKFDGSIDPNTVVVDFYERAPDGFPVADEDWNTQKQLDTLLLAQRHWADQAVSVTVYYKKEEIEQVKDWLKKNLCNIKSISFLCHNEHGFKQAPKEAITEEQYKTLSKSVVEVDLSKMNTVADDLDGLECQNGVCPVK